MPSYSLMCCTGTGQEGILSQVKMKVREEVELFFLKKSKYCPDDQKIAAIHVAMKNNVKQQQTLES